MAALLHTRPASRLVCPASARPAVATPFLRRTGRSIRSAQCSAARDGDQLQAQVVKAATISSAVGTFLAAGNVSAAQELVDSTLNTAATADGRFGLLAAALLPALGWVGYNIFGPAIYQISKTQNKASLARSVTGLGLGLATLAVAQSAFAADVADVPAEVGKVVTAASSDKRFLIILTVLLPVAGWVLFNISGPALNQLNAMNTKQKAIQGGGTRRKRGIAGAVGLTAASLLTTQQADAASEVAELALGDNRFLIILTVLLPVAGWVLFNITGPALNQLNNMQNKVKNVAKNARR